MTTIFKLPSQFIGSDYLVKRMQEVTEAYANSAMSHYPPYNIKKVDQDKYLIELAVAGFGKQDIELTLDQNKLHVKGSITSDADSNYLFKGIADRAFTRTFALADNVVIDNAKLVNGMLRVWLEHVIPESQKPKKIDIEDSEVQEKITKKSKEQ